MGDRGTFLREGIALGNRRGTPDVPVEFLAASVVDMG